MLYHFICSLIHLTNICYVPTWCQAAFSGLEIKWQAVVLNKFHSSMFPFENRNIMDIIYIISL